ncbi:hypothetical protein ScPMuIL_005718 [Solemya velum]
MAANLTVPNISVRLQNAFLKPISLRCIEIEEIIKSTSTKELQHLLPQLLENIFGFGFEQGWSLDIITRQQHPYEFESVRRFLSPDGQLLNLIYNLQADIYLTYEFALNCLPAPTRRLVEEGGITLFLVNKLQHQNFGRPVLSLSPFEFYMFHFTYCLVNPQWQRRSMNWSNISDCLYPCLVDDYLYYFLPLNKKSLPPLPHVPSPVRSPVVHSNISGKPSSSPATPRSSSRLSLFKSSFLASQKQHVQSTPVLDAGETETWRSETLLQVFVEFWLNQNTIDVDRNFMSGQPGENFLPSNNHVRLVRMLVKHLHYFVNSGSSDLTSPYHTQTLAPLDEFKKSIFPRIVQKKLYIFLRHSFDRWPLDTSFRLIVETWLTFLQPWRYTDPSHRLRFGNQSQSEAESREKTVEEKWFTFFEENLLFFTVLFQKFLHRVNRMDLMGTMSAYLVYRVTKVFSLPNLPNLLQRAESSLFGSVYHNVDGRQDIGASYLSSEIPMTVSAQLGELEQPGFMYMHFFGEKMNSGVRQVIDQAARAKTTVNQVKSKVQPAKSGLAAFFDFSSWFQDSSKVFGDLSLAEVKQLTRHLENVIKNLCDIFEMPPPHSIQEGVTGLHGLTQFEESGFLSQTQSEPSTPDCEESEEGLTLTPLGRYQLINKTKKFDTFYSGDPDLQPIRSFENAALVRVLHRICDYINKQYKIEIERMYNREDLVGRLAQVYFAPPLTASLTTSPISKALRKQLETPRLSLRFLANYRTLIYISLFYLFLSFTWGFGPVTFLLFMSLTVLVYGLLRSFSVSHPSSLKNT